MIRFLAGAGVGVLLTLAYAQSQPQGQWRMYRGPEGSVSQSGYAMTFEGKIAETACYLILPLMEANYGRGFWCGLTTTVPEY